MLNKSFSRKSIKLSNSRHNSIIRTPSFRTPMRTQDLEKSGTAKSIRSPLLLKTPEAEDHEDDDDDDDDIEVVDEYVSGANSEDDDITIVEEDMSESLLHSSTVDRGSTSQKTLNPFAYALTQDTPRRQSPPQQRTSTSLSTREQSTAQPAPTVSALTRVLELEHLLNQAQAKIQDLQQRQEELLRASEADRTELDCQTVYLQAACDALTTLQENETKLLAAAAADSAKFAEQEQYLQQAVEMIDRLQKSLLESETLGTATQTREEGHTRQLESTIHELHADVARLGQQLEDERKRHDEEVREMKAALSALSTARVSKSGSSPSSPARPASTSLQSCPAPSSISSRPHTWPTGLLPNRLLRGGAQGTHHGLQGRGVRSSARARPQPVGKRCLSSVHSQPLNCASLAAESVLAPTWTRPHRSVQHHGLPDGGYRSQGVFHAGRSRKYWYATPYPSSYHWHEDIKTLPWLRRPLDERPLLALIIGSVKTSQANSNRLRKLLYTQCVDNGNSVCQWHVTAHSCSGVDEVSVYIPMRVINEEGANFIDILRKMPDSELQKKQMAIERLAPSLQYSVVPARVGRGDDGRTWRPPHPDATDIIISRLLDPHTIEPLSGFTDEEILEQVAEQNRIMEEHEDYAALRPSNVSTVTVGRGDNPRNRSKKNQKVYGMSKLLSADELHYPPQKSLDASASFIPLSILRNHSIIEYCNSDRSEIAVQS
ncbi:unnamed protein product [Sphagnum jensenii]|uniref:Uncharacterized protein n=1 Tax=Sphagnum jensenii TaxID=128206 RepID=A0ABP0VA05_9BRYO